MKRWTKEAVCLESAKYLTKGAFISQSPLAYAAAFYHEWLDEACAHMPKRVSSQVWTFDRVMNEARQYTLRRDFKRGSAAAYDAAARNGWLGDVCGHMHVFRHQPTKWTKEEIISAARQHLTTKAFRTQAPLAYAAAQRNRCLSEACAHMELSASLMTKFVYTYKSAKSIYVGITCHPARRHRHHMGSRNKKIQEMLASSYTYDVSGPFEVSTACEMERALIAQYRKDGWDVLNRCDGGAVGSGGAIFSKTKCAAEAAKYDTRTAFATGSRRAYYEAARRGWLDEVCNHMKRKVRIPWTRDECIALAASSTSRTEFVLNSPGAYAACRKKGWLPVACAHLPRRAPKRVCADARRRRAEAILDGRG